VSRRADPEGSDPERAAPGHPDPERADVIERFSGVRQCAEALRDAVSAARGSADSLRRTVGPDAASVLATGAELVRRGVRVRIMHPRAVLHDPRHRDHLRALEDSGARVRVVDTVAQDMVLLDGHTVCLPGGRPPSQELTRISGSMLVRSLASIYETYWECATPLDQARLTSPRAELDLRELAVTRLMTCGEDDASIAARLGIGTDAVAEVAATLMRRLGAASRFELGFRLALHLDPVDGPDAWDALGRDPDPDTGTGTAALAAPADADRPRVPPQR
jgi:DNA-binding NarL/FixJ family response regulator